MRQVLNFRTIFLALCLSLVLAIIVPGPTRAQLVHEWSAPVYGTIELSDSNYIFGAQVGSADQLEIYRIGLDGQVMWKVPWNQTNPQYPGGGLWRRVVLDPMRNLHLAGKALDAAIHSMVAVYDQWGSLVFEDVYDRLGVPSSWDEDLYGFGADDAGNTFLCGQQTFEIDSVDGGPLQEVYVLKYSPLGARSWIQTYHPNDLFTVWIKGVTVDQSGYIYVTLTAVIGDIHFGDYEVKQLVVSYNTDGMLVREDDIVSLTGLDAGPVDVSTVDELGNVFLCAETAGNLIIMKYSRIGGFQWFASIPDMHALDLCADGEGNLLAIGNTQQYSSVLVKLSPGGHVLWRRDVPGRGEVAVDGAGNIYIGRKGYHEVIRVNPDGALAWTAGTNPAVYNIRVDDEASIYVSGEWSLAKYRQTAEMIIRDANNDTIPEMKFELIKVTNDRPIFTEDTLGTFETDSLGIFAFELISKDSLVFPVSVDNPEADTLLIGDTIKVARHVHSEPAVKHTGTLGSILNLHLDNAKFDSLGVLGFDTLVLGTQDIIMDHAEIRYNLLVSIEWDASQDYLESLEASFRSTANYLYDVTDGQVSLDTVLIFDDTAHWNEADKWIYANNQLWPNAWADSIHSAGQFTISMPRKWYYNVNSNRDHTYHNHPLNLDDPIEYRTKAHEFGHYALGFYDEYLYWDPSKNDYVADAMLRCVGIPRYGFMEYQAPGPDPYRSEMSNSFHYEDDLCKNTMHYGKCLASCWDFFESRFEGEYVNDASETFFIEIFKPDDTNRNSYTWPSGFVYLEGPNNDMTSPLLLDYDVGSRVVFPMAPADPAAGVKEVDVEVKIGGAPKPNVEVWLNEYISPGEQRVIKQGNTADNGRIWILGAQNGDAVQSAGFSTNIIKSGLFAPGDEMWHSGSVTIDADSMTFDMAPVDGYFPLICEGSLNATSFDCQLTAETMFSSGPTLTYRPSTGGAYDYGFGVITEGYDVTLTEPSGISGNVTVTAEDNSSDPFFFVNSYTHAVFAPSTSSIELFGPAGESQVLFNDSNETMEQTMLLSSPYTIIRTGLTEANIQASKTHSLSVYPNDAMTGNGLMRVFYSEAEIEQRGGAAEDEATLRIFRWVDGSTGWQEVGGTVDTTLNQVIETIAEPGVYAAFTTDVSVDVEDEYGDALPYRFELSQNYPNPFNPVTTIEFSLPERSHVTIEVYNILGQKVRTLLDREEAPGPYTITWNGTDSNGKSVATGVYLYRFQAGDHVETKKMLLLK